MIKTIKVIILDLHGILIEKFPTEPYLKKTKELFKKHNVEFDLEKIKEDNTTSMVTEEYGFRGEYLKMLDTLIPEKQRDDELLELLKKIQIFSYKIYIATDTSFKNAVKTLRYAQMSPLLFDGMFTGNDISKPKPHTELYSKILEKEPRIEPCEMLVIGDRITDIIPATKLGMNGFVCGYYVFKEFLRWIIKREGV